MNTISINWIIKQLLVKRAEGSLSDVVVTANWSCRASDGTFNAILTGCTEFAPPTGSFTPYEDLTEQQVLDWCYANGVDQKAIEANVTLQIENQINPPVVSLPLPWSNKGVSSGDSLPKLLKLRDEQIVDPFILPTSDVPPSVDGMSTNILG